MAQENIQTHYIALSVSSFQNFMLQIFVDTECILIMLQHDFIRKKQFELESYIAKKNLQTANFDKKWGVWIYLFN